MRPWKDSERRQMRASARAGLNRRAPNPSGEIAAASFACAFAAALSAIEAALPLAIQPPR